MIDLQPVTSDATVAAVAAAAAIAIPSGQDYFEQSQRQLLLLSEKLNRHQSLTDDYLHHYHLYMGIHNFKRLLKYAEGAAEVKVSPTVR